jgi:SAM-dependent methyltransferase
MRTKDTLQTKIANLIAEGREIARAFDRDVRQTNWHPFIAADYDVVLRQLLPLRRPGASFLECGCATGVITIMADLLGFDACGIEIDADLVAVARRLADKYESTARFALGSFLPTGYEYRDATGDGRLGTLTLGDSGFPQLARSLGDFDIVFAYPWDGESAVLEDLMKRHGRSGAQLLLYGDPGDASRRAQADRVGPIGVP